MKKIALTGNIASGKTTVFEVFKKNNIKLLDSDEVCHFALENEPDIITKIKDIFKDFDIETNGKLDRKKIGAIVFDNYEYKLKLEKILHKYAKEKVEEFFKENKNEKLCIVAVPQLFESNMQAMFDCIIMVSADDKIRLRRVQKRNNLSEKDAQKRIDAQMPQRAKEALVDYIIDNNSSIEELNSNIQEWLEDYISVLSD